MRYALGKMIYKPRYINLKVLFVCTSSRESWQACAPAAWIAVHGDVAIVQSSSHTRQGKLNHVTAGSNLEMVIPSDGTMWLALRWHQQCYVSAADGELEAKTIGGEARRRITADTEIIGEIQTKMRRVLMGKNNLCSCSRKPHSQSLIAQASNWTGTVGRCSTPTAVGME